MIMVVRVIVIDILLLLIVLLNALKKAWSFQALIISMRLREAKVAIGTDIRFGQIGIRFVFVSTARPISEEIPLL